MDDHTAYKEVVAGVVNGFLASGIPRYIDKDDMIQECLVGIHGAIAGFDGRNGASLETYLKTVVRRDVLNYLKREKRHHKRNGSPATESAIDDYVWRNGVTSLELGFAVERDEAGLSDVYHRAFRQAQEILTPEQYQVVLLKFLLGFTELKTAESLGITPEAVASRWRKARTKLGENLKKDLTSRYETENGRSLSRYKTR